MVGNIQPHDPLQRTVLIVDDMFLIRKTLRSILEFNDYHVCEANNSQSAIDMIKGGLIPDLIILDIKMPGLEGLGLCRVLKAFEPTKNVPVLICTGESKSKTVRDAVKFGADGFIAKPLDHDIIRDRVTEITGGPYKPPPDPVPTLKKPTRHRKTRKRRKKSNPPDS